MSWPARSYSAKIQSAVPASSTWVISHHHKWSFVSWHCLQMGHSGSGEWPWHSRKAEVGYHWYMYLVTFIHAWRGRPDMVSLIPSHSICCIWGLDNSSLFLRQVLHSRPWSCCINQALRSFVTFFAIQVKDPFLLGKDRNLVRVLPVSWKVCEKFACIFVQENRGIQVLYACQNLSCYNAFMAFLCPHQHKKISVRVFMVFESVWLTELLHRASCAFVVAGCCDFTLCPKSLGKEGCADAYGNLPLHFCSIC